MTVICKTGQQADEQLDVGHVDVATEDVNVELQDDTQTNSNIPQSMSKQTLNTSTYNCKFMHLLVNLIS